MAIAVVTVDLLYAILGLAGLGHLLVGSGLRVVFGLVSAATIVVIGARTLCSASERGLVSRQWPTSSREERF